MKNFFLILFFSMAFNSFAIKIENMPYEEVEKSLYLKNSYRERKQNKRKILKKTNKNNRKSNTFKTRNSKKIISQKPVSTKQNKKVALEEKENFEKKIEKRLIFDYDNAFSIKEIKALHKKLEKLIFLKNIDFRVIYNIEKREINIFESISKHFPKDKNKFLIISREQDRYALYSNLGYSKLNEIEKIISIINLDNNNSFYNEMDKIINNISKYFFYNKERVSELRDLGKDENNFNGYIYILVLAIFSTLYIVVSISLKYFEKIRKRGF